MGINITDNFDPKVPKFIDNRQSFETLQDMLAFDTNLLPEGFETYCVETDKKYKYLSTNITRLDTGKWGEVTNDGGSGVLEAKLTFTKDVGYINKGTTYGVGTKIEDILREMVYREAIGSPTYYGYFDCDATGVAVTNPTVDQIKALNSEVVGTKEFTFHIDNMRYGQIAYAYPKSFGELSKIIVDNAFNYINSSCTKISMDIDGIDYVLYFFTEPVGLENVPVECA